MVLLYIQGEWTLRQEMNQMELFDTALQQAILSQFIPVQHL
jgi:hypothetical protein